MLIYKSGHQESECAFKNLELALQTTKKISAYVVDVNMVLDIHPKYGVTQVPSLLVFKKNKFKSVAEGCQNNNDFKSVLESIIHMSNFKK